MSVGRLSVSPVQEWGLPVIRVLQTFWGVVLIIGLGVYTLHGAMTYEAPLRVVPPRGMPVLPARTGNAVLSSALVSEPLVVHFACGMEDARIARTYDPPASGRALIMRYDQSADQMRAVLNGADPRFPTDTRIVTTTCMQGLLNDGTFP